MTHTTLRALLAPTFAAAVVATTAHGQWSFETLPNPRDAIAMTALNGKVYFAGGSDTANNWVDTIDVFDEATGTWSSLTLPAAMIRAGAAAVGQSVFFGCGWEDPAITITANVYEYDTVLGTWTTHGISQARYGTAFAAVGPYLVIAGGNTGGGVSDFVDVYDSTTGTWSSLTIPVAVDDPAFAVSGGTLWLCGGESTTTIPIPDMQFVDPAAASSGTIASMGVFRGRISGGSASKRSWFLGGLDAGFNPLDDFDAVDTDPFAQSFGTLPTAVYAAPAVAAGNRLVVAGGLDPTTFTPLSQALVIDVDDTITQTVVPAPAGVFPPETLLGFHTGTSSGRSAYFAGGNDTAFDPSGEVVVYTHPDEFWADTAAESLSTGGTAGFSLDLDPSLGGNFYFVLGSLSGTAPGIPVGAFVVPLNIDAYFNYTLANPNTIALIDTFGLLDANGDAEAALFLPPGINPGLAGTTASHAAAVISSTTGELIHVSNAAGVGLLP